MEGNKSKSGVVGLSYPMLDRSNYTAWSLKIKVFMQAHEVWEAVEPKDPKLSVEERKDKIALAMIYQGIPEDMLLTLAEKKTAKGAWDAIKTLCQGAERVKKARVQTLKAEFESLSMKDTEVLDDFCMKLHGLVTNIRALGEPVEEAYVVKKLLRVVPPKFLQITSTMEQFGNLEVMTMEEAVGSLKAHEERLKGQEEKQGGQLLLTEDEWVKRESDEGKKLLYTREEWLKRGNKVGEVSSSFRGRGRDKSKIKCYNCNILGHYAAECRKPRRMKEQKQEVNIAEIEDEEPALLLAKHDKTEESEMLLNEKTPMPKLLAAKEVKRGESNLWYLDNGASNHMTGQKSKFTELDEGITGQVKFGDGSTVKIEGKGSIIFKCKNGEERTLHEVYYIPSLCSNIISLGQLSEVGNRVILKSDFLWVFDNQERLLMKVKRSTNRLYKLIIETSKPICLLTKTDEISKLWHTRLGHVNYQALELMYKNKMVHGFPRIISPKHNCTGCLMSKQTRRPFPSQTQFTTKRVLELVHADLCGPITPTTTGGNRSFMLLVDDYSRVMWVYLLKSKDEAFNAFKLFRAKVENGGERKVRVLRTDRGGEFTSKEFADYCEKEGITRHFTAPYTPQ